MFKTIREHVRMVFTGEGFFVKEGFFEKEYY